MSIDHQWIGTRITEARTQQPLVTEAVSSRVAKVLERRLSEQQLTNKELEGLAKDLLADMDPKPPKTDTKR